MKRRSTFVRRTWAEHTSVTRRDAVVVVGAFTVAVIAAVVALSAQAATPRPATLGPERSDRAYCWYVSDPCSTHDQLPTK